MWDVAGESNGPHSGLRRQLVDWKFEDLSLTSNTHTEKSDMTVCICNARDGRQRQGIPGAHWQVSLAQSVSSRLSERSCLKKQKVESY